MASVSSLGVGSGIDLQSLVEGLVESETQSRLGRLDVREAIATERLSAYGLLKSSVAIFDNALSSLGNISTFQGRLAKSSDEEAFTVSASENAGLGSYAIEVTNAGAAHSLTAAGLVDVTNTVISSADTAIGGGSLLIQQGAAPSFAVTISPAASSLNQIAEAINLADGNTGVTASVINADSGPVLVINASDTGTENQITITVDDIDGDDTNAQGLSQLTFDALDLPGSNLNQQTIALDTEITVNGLAVSSASGNTFSNVINGVTITALAETTAAGTATVTKNTQQATTAVNEFVDSFNELVTTISDLGRGSVEDSESAGVLVGDSVLRSLGSSIRRVIFNSIDATQPAGVQSLSDIGVQFNRDGKLTLDSAKFNELLESNFDDVARLLAADGEPIAQNQQLQSVSFDTVSTVVGEGQLLITTGETNFTVDISVGAGNTTVQGIRDAINNAVDNTGVTASIILEDDGAGGTDARLILASDSAGESATVTIAVTDSDANNTDLLGLSQLASENLTELVAAEIDAPEGIIVRLQSALDSFLGGIGEKGVIDTRTEGLNRDIDRIQDTRVNEERRLENFEARLVAQFSSLDLLVANLKSSGDFLLSQLNAASNITLNRNSNDS
jgi:flagellar hook-associated protein 2